MCIRDRVTGVGSASGRWPVATVPLAEPDDREGDQEAGEEAVSYTHLRAHETPEHLVCRLMLEKKKQTKK